MRNKLSKITIFSIAIILSLLIMFLPLAFMPELGANKGDSLVSKTADSTPIQNSTTIKTKDGSVENKTTNNSDIHYKINNADTFNKFFEQSGDNVKKIGLLTCDIKELTLDLSKQRDIPELFSLDGNGYTITIKGVTGDLNFKSDKNYSNKNMYYGGGLVGLNKGTIKNLNVVLDCDIDFTYTTGDAQGAFASGILCSINQGEINNVSVSVTNKSNFTPKATNYDMFVGGIAGVNSKNIYNVTVVNDGKSKIIAGQNGRHYTAVGGVVGVMYSNDLYSSVLSIVTILGSGHIEATTGDARDVGTVVGINDTCHMEWYNEGNTNRYKIGKVNGVLHGYTGTITGRVNSKNIITGCGFASNIFMTDNTIKENEHLGSCQNGDKIYGNIINPNAVDISGKIAKVELSFNDNANLQNAIVDIKATIDSSVNDKAIIYDVDVDTYTNGATPQNSVIVNVNDDNKIKENHKKVEFSVEGTTANSEGKFDKNKVININYGSLGSVEYTEDTNHAYTGQIKGSVTFKKYTSEQITFPKENYSVLGYTNTGFEKLMFPGKYTKIKVQMNGKGNDSFAMYDKEKRIIVPVLEKTIDYEIIKGELEVEFADKNGNRIPNPSEAGFKNGYKITVKVKGTGLENAIDGFDLIFKDINDNPVQYEGKTVTIDTGEYGMLGKNIIIVGTKNGRKVTNFSDIYNLKLDAVAPEYDIIQDVKKDYWYYDNFPTMKIRVKDNTSGIKSVDVNNNTLNVVKDNKDGTYDITFKQPGESTYKITITDNVGNETVISREKIKIDLQEPNISVVAKSNNKDYIAGEVTDNIVKFIIDINNNNITNPSGYTVYMIVNGNETIIGDGQNKKQFIAQMSKNIDRDGDQVSFKVVAKNGRVKDYNFGKVILKIDNKNIEYIEDNELLLNGKPIGPGNTLTKEYDGTTKLLTTHKLTVDKKDNIIVNAYYSSAEVRNNVQIFIELIDKNGEKIYIFRPSYKYGNITPINVKIDIEDKSIKYGDNINEFSYVLKNTNGDIIDLDVDFDVYVEGHKGESILNAGSYNLVCDLPNLKNYNFTLEKGKLNIAKRQVYVEIDPEHSPYGIMYTGKKHYIKAYFTDYNGKRVDLKVVYSGQNGDRRDPYIDKGNYIVKFSFEGDYGKNYELKGDIEIPYEITAFKPVFEIDGLKNGVLRVPYFYGTDVNRFKINIKDNSYLLDDSVKERFNDYLTIYYDGIKNAYPTAIGEYNVNIEFDGADKNINFGKESIVFKYIIEKADFTNLVVEKNTIVTFDGKEHSPNITGFPNEFVNSKSNYYIKYITKKDFNLLSQDEKNKENILYVVYNYNTKSENLNDGIGQYCFGNYHLDIVFYNVNYNELKSNGITMTINFPTKDYIKSAIGVKSESHVYNTKPMLINVPEFSSKDIQIKLVKIWLLDNKDQHKSDMSEFIDEGVTDVGTYRFVYEITIKSINESVTHEPMVISDIELEITPANLNEDDIDFYMEGEKIDFDSDVPITKDYDGNPLEVSAIFKGTADGATLSYEREKYVDARVQYVKVTVSKPNYNNYVKLLPKAYINKIVVTPEKKSEYKIIIGQDKKNKEILAGTFKGIDGQDIKFVVDTSSIKDINKAGTYECKIVSTNKNYVIDESVATVTLVISKDYVKIGVTTAVCVTIFLLIASAITYHYVRRYIKLKIKDNQLGEV